MKQIIVCVIALFAFIPPLIISTATAYNKGLDSISLSGTIVMPPSGIDRLIDKLNDEADRIDHNNSWEDVDGVPDPAIEAILSAMNLQSTERMSEIELDTYLTSRFEITDTLDRYTRILPE